MKARLIVYYHSCAMKSHFRKFGNQMSGSGNHLCEFTRAVFYLGHTPPAWTCHAQHQLEIRCPEVEIIYASLLAQCFI